nr:methyltransferase [Chloroflexota bacterium]
LAGARSVVAIDIEAFAISAAELNAEANRVDIDVIEKDPVDTDDGWEIVLVGDLWYEDEVAARLAPWLRSLAARGATVLTGDLGRAYLPTSGLTAIATYEVRTEIDLEDADLKTVRILRVDPAT